MIQVESRHKKIISDILSKYPYRIYAYGSRVKGNAQRYSDLDLCYKENIPGHIVSQITEDFEESMLPFKVELANYRSMSPDFQKLIAPDLVELTI